MTRQPQETRCEQAALMLIDRLEGNLGDVESALLERHLGDCAACRREAVELAETWDVLGGLPEPAAPPAVGRRFRWWLRGQLRPSAASGGGDATVTRWSRPLGWTAALAASLVLGVGLGSRREQSEIDGLRADVQALNQLVALSLLKQSSASERLLGVAQGRETAGSDETMVRALLSAATGDANANVRLAAVDALAPMARRGDVRDALLAAFPSDTSPLVQAAIGAVLLDAEDAEARRRLAGELESRSDLDPGVRDYLTRRISNGGTV